VRWGKGHQGLKYLLLAKPGEKVHDPGVIRWSDPAGEERKAPVPSRGRRLAGGEEPAAEEMEFRGKGTLEARQEGVVVGVRIVDRGDSGEGTEFEEAGPVGAGPG